MNNILLDTNCFIWLTLDNPNLGPKTKKRIQDAPNLIMSSLSILEVQLKQSKRKLSLGVTIPQAVDALSLQILSFNFQQALGFTSLNINNDPFDNAICVIAIQNKLELFTSDDQLLSASIPGLRTWNTKQ